MVYRNPQAGARIVSGDTPRTLPAVGHSAYFPLRRAGLGVGFLDDRFRLRESEDVR